MTVAQLQRLQATPDGGRLPLPRQEEGTTSFGDTLQNAIDQVDGRIYAAEFISNRVRVVNSDGSLIAPGETGVNDALLTGGR